ncbi:MAG: TonB-dependent receptor plug domain-containing protein, partial [Dysgonamonadaceae bacterium]|nr:TonB-dependent receptor plug domain-containing protein [Dysgonamonadaceae bacterium]
MTKRFSIFTIFQCLAVCVVFAQQPEDSVRVHDLPELQVQASAITTSTSLVQTLSAAQLEKLNVLQASDAMKHLSGVQVKDYGGVGGLKTVSIRSLGANYTAVAVDGIAVSDYQTGQIDLGRFSLENIESIRLNIGESDNIFQPARNQALGGLIQLISQNSLSSESKREEWKAGLKAGSWQLWNPFVTYSRAFNPQWNINLSSSFLTTKGDYPFQIHYGQTDSTSWHRRINSDVKRGNAELNLNGKFRNGGRLNAKLYAFLSERGIPGRVIFYNPYSGEKVKDCNLFAQVNYNQSLNEKWQWQANAKGSRSVMNDWGAGLDNQYA